MSGSSKKEKDGVTDRQLEVASEWDVKTTVEMILSRPTLFLGPRTRGPLPKGYAVWDIEANAFARAGEEPEWESVPCVVHALDEILVNALDQVARTRGARKGADRTTRIDVTIDAKSGRVSVFNDGPGIPWETHLKTGRPLVETLFGTNFSSSNYRDDEDRFTGGCNGMGAFLTNVWSTQFDVETRAAVTPKDDIPKGVKKRPRPKSIVYAQSWSRNSCDVGEPTTRADYETKSGYTRVTFTPDWARLKLKGPTRGVLAAWARRVIDVAGTTPADVEVTLNGAAPPVQGFEAYSRALYAHYGGDPEAVAMQTLKTTKGEAWEAAVVPAPGPRRGGGVPRSVSFVNGVATVAGGTHVNYLLDLLATGLAKRAKSGGGGGGGGGKVVLTADHVKGASMVFLRASVPTPTFGHQTKDTLSTPRAKLAVVLPKVPDAALRGMATDAMIEAVRARAAADAAATLSAASRKTGSTGVTTASAARRIAEMAPNYAGASLAGTKRARECALFLAEGLSAKTMIMSGIAAVGRDRHGVFPLKGVPLNAATATSAELSKNVELSALVAVMGLVYGRTYDASLQGLRYGHVVLMMDQDHDGSHIKGLILEFFRTHWPSLFKVKGFLQEFATPIVRVRAATVKARTEPGPAIRSFYTLPDFDAWRKSRGARGTAGWDVKYYKGLGSSRPEEGREYMRARDEHCYRVTADKPADFGALDMAFNKGEDAVRERRAWMDRVPAGGAVRRYGAAVKTVSVTDFMDREYRLFVDAANRRHLPSALDGLKVVQRKVLWALRQMRVTGKPDKVSSLTGKVMSSMAYAHGEASLAAAISFMARTFVGADNLPLLFPDGQFGSRLEGGKDASSPRYIFTRLTHIANLLFPPADDPHLPPQSEDGKPVEPAHLVPTLPMALVNGSSGLGWAWSNNSLNHDPVACLDWVRARIRRDAAAAGISWKEKGRTSKLTKAAAKAGLKSAEERLTAARAAVVPHYRGFTGTLTPDESTPNKWVSEGRWAWHGDDLVVTELPVHVWTSALTKSARALQLTTLREFLAKHVRPPAPPAGSSTPSLFWRLYLRATGGGAVPLGPRKRASPPVEVAAKAKRAKAGAKAKSVAVKPKAKSRAKVKVEAEAAPVASKVWGEFAVTAVSDESTDREVKMTLTFHPMAAAALRDEVGRADVGRVLPLRKSLTQNANMFRADGSIASISTADDILEPYFGERLRLYEARLAAQREALRLRIAVLGDKITFVRAVAVERSLDVQAPDSRIATSLARAGVSRRDPETLRVVTKSEAAAGGAAGEARDALRGWGYVMKMQVRSLTKARMEDLERELRRLEEELRHLEAMCALSLWDADLDALEPELRAVMDGTIE